MCGIFCSFCENSDRFNHLLEVWELFEPNLKNRGPDYLEAKTVECEGEKLVFAASVLWLQGLNLVKQPLEDDKSVFVYNGDIFGGSVITADEKGRDGDTIHFWKNLNEAQNIVEFLAKIEGPYSFIYFNKKEKRLFFGRDPYGRRSLLLGKNNETVVLCSVAKRTPDYKFIEVPTIGIFCYNFENYSFQVFPWQYKSQNYQTKLNELEHFLDINIQTVNLLECVNNKIFSPPTKPEYNLLLSVTLNDNIFEQLLSDKQWFSNTVKLNDLLEAAVHKRISTQPKHCSECLLKTKPCHHTLTGVLFSGGVDCAILALLCDKFTEENRPIDLINVAFSKVEDYKTPDRITGLQTLEELRKLRPNRPWNFIEINVTEEELNKERENHIADLIYPLNSILDDSLGCALWFASRASTNNYMSPCRVILVGMGADELFGGYTKHRNAFRRKGWEGLYEILEEDWQNLPHRNLARDDRVVSDHGRQLRTPYLDEDVVKFVRNLNVWEKTCPLESFPRGIGEKILLRSLAFHLGLENACILKKKALQFGSRIANSKENAHDVSLRLL